jgi:hypothetical protein
MEIEGIPAGGCLDGVEVLARTIHDRLEGEPKLVWMDDDGVVYIGDRDVAAGLPSYWIVGTFQAGHSLGEIAQDLAATANERESEFDKELRGGDPRESP